MDSGRKGIPKKKQCGFHGFWKELLRRSWKHIDSGRRSFYNHWEYMNSGRNYFNNQLDVLGFWKEFFKKANVGPTETLQGIA